VKKADLVIYYSFLISCPYCGYPIDLADSLYDYDGDFSKHVFSNRQDELKGVLTKCIICDKVFEINEVER
jgi:hypothetical protein